MKQAIIAGFAFAAASFGVQVSTSDADVKMYTLNCGEIDMLDLSFFAKGGEFDGRQNKATDSCFLIRHPKGDLLWDTGLPDAIADLPEGMKVPGFAIRVPKTLKSQLADIGVSPGEIEYLSISHSHFDHAGNMNDYAGSTWIVNEAEYAHMFRDDARKDAQTFGAYNKLENSKKITFKGDHDVFGDGSVMILAMPGHTPGHSSLLVNLKHAGPVLLTGDLYHLTESRERRTVPTFNTNADDTYKSMDRFEALAKEKGARVIIQHEKADVATLPKAPAYID